MLVTTKGRYAMRLMIYVASSNGGGNVALRHIAEAEGISFKYLEQLAHSLVNGGLLESVRGHGGGYRLALPAEQIKAGDVLRAAEGSTAPVECSGLDEGCPREDVCPTLSFWAGLDRTIKEYVDSVTIAELVDNRPCNVSLP